MPHTTSTDSPCALASATAGSNPPATTVGRPPVCHGRVREADFERMVPAQWWKTVFADDLYLKTDGDVVEDPEITREEIRMLESNPAILSIFNKGSLRDGEPLSAPGRILDLCCGQGRHTLLLAEKYPHLELFGHDQSFYLVNLARERAVTFAEAQSAAGRSNIKNSPVFTVGDCRSVPFKQHNFDFVMLMGNSFGYFSANDSTSFSADGTKVDAADRQVLREINRVLRVGGQMVLDLADGDYMRENFSPRSWEWIDDQTFACRERTLSADKSRLHSREVVVVANRGVVRDQFYSERLYGRQELVDLLRATGFDIEVTPLASSADSSACDEAGVNTVTAARELSQRGQDLGMMEQRLLIFARKIAEVQTSDLEDLPVALPEYSQNSVQHLADSGVFLSAIQGDEKEIVTADPVNYWRLSTPPFPDGKIAVVMGDPSLSCREKLNGVWNPEDFDTRRKLVEALLECGYRPDQISVIENHDQLLRTMVLSPPSYVFNLCDEGFRNDATKELHVAAYFEMCNIAYSGAGPASLAICYDKGLVNATAAKLDIYTPRETYILLPEALDPKDINACMVDKMIAQREHSGDILYPAFLKPMKGDNSLGITGRSICHNRSDLTSYLCALVDEYGFKEFIVQEYLTGTEYSVGMIGNPETGFHFLPILQVDYSKVVSGYGLQPILGWESKWDPDSPYWNEIDYVVSPRISDPKQQKSKSTCAVDEPTVCSNEAPDVLASRGYMTGGLTAHEEQTLKRWCTILFERFGLRDYARFDWRADREVFYHPQTGHRCLAAHVDELDDSLSPNTPHAADTSSGSSPNDDASSESTSSFRDSDLGSLPSAGISSSRSSSDAADDREPRDRSADDHHHHRQHLSDNRDDSSNSDPPADELRRLKLLEVNPNPGWCWDGKMAKMMHADGGKSYSDLIKSVLWASWFRLYGRSVDATGQSVSTRN